MTARWKGALALGLALAAALAGCKRTGDVSNPSPAPGQMPPSGMPMMGGMPMMIKLEETEPHAAGKKAFNANRCSNCHTVSSLAPAPEGPKDGLPQGFPKEAPPMGGPPRMGGPRKGPDLSNVGGKAEHTVEWLMAYVRNPKEKKPDSRMPRFEKIPEDDLRSLAEFLASLKKAPGAPPSRP